jgi:hypothetical protein
VRLRASSSGKNVKRALAQYFAAAALAVSTLGLPAAASAQAPGYSPPRTPDGKPELGGFWTNRSEAPLERPDSASSLVVSRDEYAASRADGGAGYSVQSVRGQLRTSHVVDPPDGKLPFNDRAAALAWSRRYGVYLFTGKDAGFTAGPESLPLRERCLISGNAAGPPIFRPGYNAAYQIVQTGNYFVINTELIHEARIVPVFKSSAAAAKGRRPPVLQRWTGDSVGWWEGDTLVVETTGINAMQGTQSDMPLSKDGLVVERFTRTGDDELFYEFEVTDATYYARPWKAESSFRPGHGVLEYACHEGNYGLPGILAGARKMEGASGSPGEK